MAVRRLILASASTARLGVLRRAGIDPEVMVSGVDEPAALDDLDDAARSWPDAQAQHLATAKASAVASQPDAAGALVLGCDSLFAFQGAVHGKPASAEEATTWITAMAGETGTLWTGHSLIDVATGASTERTVATTVHFSEMTDDEIAGYVGSGEPLGVAGAFTLDGRSGVFIEGVDGDPANVIGVSLPALRELVTELDGSIMDLW